MQQRAWWGSLCVGLASVVTLAGCASAQLRMPDGFSAGDAAWPVSGHSPRRFGEPVRFGPYSALELKEGATFSWALPARRMDVGGSARRYAFTLLGIGEAPVEVQCRVRTLALGHDSVNGRVESRTELDLTALRGPMLGCGLHHDDTAEVLSLELARDGVKLHGKLVAPWAMYEVRSLHGYEGLSISAHGVNGFEVVRDGRPVMVVDMLDSGRVYLDASVEAEQRTYLAAAAAALLLLGEDAEA